MADLYATSYNIHMLIDLITKLPAYIYYVKVKSLEKKLGFKVELSHIITIITRRVDKLCTHS